MVLRMIDYSIKSLYNLITSHSTGIGGYDEKGISNVVSCNSVGRIGLFVTERTKYGD